MDLPILGKIKKNLLLSLRNSSTICCFYVRAFIAIAVNIILCVPRN
jgi:hypothetical protein